ncbi:MAG: hypothetical protein ACRDHP_19545, partial [Ktedonobacterales bacterium]
LLCRDGHFEMVSFELKNLESGCWMWVACEFDGHHGGHWLAPDSRDPARLVVASQPYLWPSAHDAYAARDHWEQQDGA